MKSKPIKLAALVVLYLGCNSASDITRSSDDSKYAPPMGGAAGTAGATNNAAGAGYGDSSASAGVAGDGGTAGSSGQAGAPSLPRKLAFASPRSSDGWTPVVGEAWQIIDLDTDGLADLIFTTGTEEDPEIKPGLWAAWGKGDGQFRQGPEDFPTSLSSAGSAIHLFRSGPGQPTEVLLGLLDSSSITILHFAGRTPQVKKIAVPQNKDGGYYSMDTVALDLDGDGLLDVAGIGRSDPLITTWRQLKSDPSNPTFASPTDANIETPLPRTSEQYTVADADGDGKMDLLSSSTTGGVRLLLSQGDGSFAEIQWENPLYNPDTDHAAHLLAVGDLDGDGRADAVVADPSPQRLRIFRNEGGGKASLLPQDLLQNFRPIALATGDLDGDGKADLVVSEMGQFSVLHWRPDGSFERFVLPYESKMLYFDKIRLADVDSDGMLDVVFSKNAGTTTFFNRSE